MLSAVVVVVVVVAVVLVFGLFWFACSYCFLFLLGVCGVEMSILEIAIYILHTDNNTQLLEVLGLSILPTTSLCELVLFLYLLPQCVRTCYPFVCKTGVC